MNNIKQRIDELSNEFNQRKTKDDSKKLLEAISDLGNEADITHVEKIVLLINQCIILDALNIDNITIEGKNFNRSSIAEEIKIFYEEFISNSIIDEWEISSNFAFREKISYYIALILYKVHDYAEAHTYFVASRKFSDKLNEIDEINGLDLHARIKRDIHFAYCCEYMETPKMDCTKLVESLQILLGSHADMIDPDKYWEGLKNHIYNHIDELENIMSLDTRREDKKKAFNIIKLLLKFSNDKNSVFSKLEKMESCGGEIADELVEAIHVLAHCLNELNIFWGKAVLDYESGQSDDYAMEYLKKKGLIKMISSVCIDALGEKYGTCQATIRAEQENGIDAIRIMHNMKLDELSDLDKAELDFYQYYFESMFPYWNYEKVHEHGKKFCEFCNKNMESDPDNYQDGLLHYYVVLLKNQLKVFLKQFVESSNKNEEFFNKEKGIRGSDCFETYEQLRKKTFSRFVNAQMVYEREKLITVYKILRNMQKCRIPLFYEEKYCNKELDVDENVNELYGLCKKFNRYSPIKSFSLREIEKDEIDGRRRDIVNPNTIVIKADGLTFEFIGTVARFEEYLRKYSMDNYKIETVENAERKKLNLENKILYFDDENKCYECCEELSDNMKVENSHIFYVGRMHEDFEFKTIAAFDSINLCFLMAYIYNSIERILDYILYPASIYILAPLRNVSDYEFQEAKFEELLKIPQNYIAPIKIKSDGMGVRHQTEKIREDYFDVKFVNDDVKNACIMIVKLYRDKLYVLKGGKLVHKNAHIGLVDKMHDDYAKARKARERTRHENCTGEYSEIGKCMFFYKLISDDMGISKKDKGAGKKLLHLLHIACEEHIFFDNQHYLFDASFVEKFRLEDGGFQICIFDKDITRFIGDQCLKNIITVTPANIENEKQKNRKSPQKESDDRIYVEEIDEEREELLKNLKEFEDTLRRDRDTYEQENYLESLPELNRICEETRKLIEQTQNAKAEDIKKIKDEYFSLKRKYKNLSK